jgi:hypothetical protein
MKSIDKSGEYGNESLAEILITRSRIAQASGDVAYAHIGLREALHLLYPTGPRIFIPAVLEGLASIESMHGDPQRAAQLLAAASTLRRPAL